MLPVTRFLSGWILLLFLRDLRLRCSDILVLGLPTVTGANSLYLAADGKLGMGDGALTTSTGAFSQSRGDLSESAISLTGGLLNIVLSVTGGNGNQAVDVYVNGDFFDSLSYNGNMNGNQSSVTSWINPNLTWGEIQWTNEALAEDRIAGFAGLQVPEPASASLGILGLAVMMMRRRRS